MKVPQSGLQADNPALPLLQTQVAYWGTTSAAGNALGTTLVCADLDNHPTYRGNRVKILDGGAAGQDRQISAHAAGGILTVDAPYTSSSGAAQQIAAGIRFAVLTNSGGAGGGAGMPPTTALWMFGIVGVAQVASTTIMDIPHLAGFQNDTFNGEFYMEILNAGGAAPEGQKRIIQDYVGATGRFTVDAFGANVEAGDIVAIYHKSIEAIDIAARGTLDTSSATVPADSTRAEADNHFRGHLLIPTEGTYAGRATRIVAYTGAGGIFTLDPNNPLPGVTGLVDYIVVKSQGEFVPAADGANNRTPADVIGNKTDTIPAMNLAPGDDSLVRQVKALLERLGATPADPDDSALTNLGQRDDAATLDTLADVTTTSIQAKLRRLLERLSPDAFTATVQGVARTELDTILYQVATYISALGAAYSATVNPGAAAKTNIEQTLEDLGEMLAGAAGIVTFPAAAAPANGVSIAEALRETYNDVIAIQQAVNGQPALVQATFTGNLANAGTATICALDALGGAMRGIRVKVWISGAVAGAGITPGWYVTRYSALGTFTQQTVPSLGAQHAPAAAVVEDYEVGDLPDGLQGELRIASAGDDSGLSFEATVTYLT